MAYNVKRLKVKLWKKMQYQCSFKGRKVATVIYDKKDIKQQKGGNARDKGGRHSDERSSHLQARAVATVTNDRVTYKLEQSSTGGRLSPGQEHGREGETDPEPAGDFVTPRSVSDRTACQQGHQDVVATPSPPTLAAADRALHPAQQNVRSKGAVNTPSRAASQAVTRTNESQRTEIRQSVFSHCKGISSKSH